MAFEVWNVTPSGELKSNHNAFDIAFETRAEAEIRRMQCLADQAKYPPELHMIYEIREVA